LIVVRRRAVQITAVIGLLLGTALMSEACRTATQVELVVTYDGACTDLQEVAFIIGTDPTVAEGRIESNVFTTTTSHCEAGSPSRVGTLVVTPNDATGRAAIIVLASFGGQHVTECKPEKGYAGCIVARRAFAFVDHTALTLDIPLETSCKNVPCDAESTCKNASCVTSGVSCGERGCGQPGVIADGGIEFTDAPTNPDAYVQGLDAQPPRLDAQPPPFDGAFDGPPPLDGSPPPLDGSAETGTGTCTGMGTAQPVACTTSMGPRTCFAPGTLCGYSAVGTMTPDGGTPPGYACRLPGDCNPSAQNPSIACRSTANCPANSVCCLNMLAGSVSCTTPGITTCIGGGMSVQTCAQECECQANEVCVPGPALGTAPPQVQVGVCQTKPAQP
jgi:hypothetical protein